MVDPVQMLLVIVSVYALPGVLFAIAFVTRGAAATDPAAGNAPLRVRVLFAPGAIALWPILAAKWARAGQSS